MANAGNDGYYDGLTDSNGNLTAYGQLLVSQGKARRTGDGAILINGGLPQTGSANNPSGPDSSGPPAGSAPATGATGAPLTGGGGAPPTSTSNYNPGDVIIANDGRMGIWSRHTDPQTGQWTYGFLYFPQPGTPEFEANGGWATVEQQTGIQASFMDAAYRTAKANYDQSKAAATKLGNYTVIGVNADGSVQAMKGDGTTLTITAADVAAGKYPGITDSDLAQAKSQYQSAQANLTSASQWHFAGIDPATGKVQIQNNGTKEIKTVSAEEAAGYAGVNPLDIQQAQSAVVQGNWNNANAFGPQFQGMPGGSNPATPPPAATTPPAAATPPAADHGPSPVPAPLPNPIPPGYVPPPEGVGPPETPAPLPPSGGGTWGASAAAQAPQGLPGGSAAASTATLGQYAAPQQAAGAPYTATPYAPTGLPQRAPVSAANPMASRMPQLPLPQASPPGNAGSGAYTVGSSNLSGGSPAPLPQANPSAKPAPSFSPQQQAQYQAVPLPKAAPGGAAVASTTTTPPPASAPSSGTVPYTGGVTGINAAAAQQGMTNQQLDLRNRTYQNLSNYVRAGNVGSRNLSGMGSSALGRPIIAGQ